MQGKFPAQYSIFFSTCDDLGNTCFIVLALQHCDFFFLSTDMVCNMFLKYRFNLTVLNTFLVINIAIALHHFHLYFHFHLPGNAQGLREPFLAICNQQYHMVKCGIQRFNAALAQQYLVLQFYA